MRKWALAIIVLAIAVLTLQPVMGLLQRSAIAEVIDIEATPLSAEPEASPFVAEPSPAVMETEAPEPVATAAPEGPSPLDNEPVPRLDENVKLVALTFDDGPYAGVTDKILDTVEQYSINNVHVTFFTLGIQVLKHPELIVRAQKLGCEIGNHTYGHKKLTKLPNDEMLAQVQDLNEMIREITDEEPKLVRPPYGARDENVCATIRYPLILWDIDTLDWSTHDAAKTIEAALKCQDGDIILMHDVHEDTAEAAATIIPALLEQGFTLVTVSELFEVKGITLEPGVAYRYAR